ncbi:hypothetical protein Hanom_Chr01g00072861 [Helianthus anomalus]
MSLNNHDNHKDDEKHILENHLVHKNYKQTHMVYNKWKNIENQLSIIDYFHTSIVEKRVTTSVLLILTFIIIHSFSTDLLIIFLESCKIFTGF